VQGLTLYRQGRLDNNVFECVTCHTLPTGAGTDHQLVGFQFQPIAPGPMGQRHLQVVSVDGTTNVTTKTPHLRNLYEKTGFNTTQLTNTAGFGVLHDGAVDSIERFINEPVFTTPSDQATADLVAFLLAFSGSELPQGSPTSILEPPGPPSKDTHAAVGVQTTLIDQATAPAAQLQQITDMINLANTNKVGLVVKGRVNSLPRGYTWVPASALFQADRAGQTFSAAALRALAVAGGELTYTVVPKGSETRIGIDRDLDGTLDGDEPGGLGCYANCNADLDGQGLPMLTVADFGCFQTKFVQGDPYCDCNQDGTLTVADFGCYQTRFVGGCQ
jgi:hypothetical protein